MTCAVSCATCSVRATQLSRLPTARHGVAMAKSERAGPGFAEVYRERADLVTDFEGNPNDS
jgi:hypothetical protein